MKLGDILIVCLPETLLCPFDSLPTGSFADTETGSQHLDGKAFHTEIDQQSEVFFADEAGIQGFGFQFVFVVAAVKLFQILKQPLCVLHGATDGAHPVLQRQHQSAAPVFRVVQFDDLFHGNGKGILHQILGMIRAAPVPLCQLNEIGGKIIV